MDRSRSGAGGKILVYRRKQRLASSPYSRSPLSPPPVNSLNWFSRLVFPSAIAIASGAGKIISSVLYSDSESSSEDEDEEYTAEYDLHNENVVPHDGVDALDERTQTKRIIEQLIMHETFSREECDKLTEVLQSRVRYWSMDEENRFSASPQKIIDEDGDIYNAVLEAKKWFEKKKNGSAFVINPDKGSCDPSSSGIEHPLQIITQVNSLVDSPLEVARSHMRDRPSWASPMKHNELGTPLSTSIEFFKEGAPYSVGHESSSLSKQRDSPPSGSWIQDESRKVRSKATEDMLHTPSSKIDPSSKQERELKRLESSVNYDGRKDKG